MSNRSSNKERVSGHSPGERRVKRLAKFLDSKFQLGPVKLGWDSIIGLIPGVGDSIGTLASSYIVYEAVSHNMPRSVIARMIANIFIDSILGSLPLLGDLADVFWKANNKNAFLFSRELDNPSSTKTRSALWLFLLVLGLLLALALSIYLPIKLIMIIFGS